MAVDNSAFRVMNVIVLLSYNLPLGLSRQKISDILSITQECAFVLDYKFNPFLH